LGFAFDVIDRNGGFVIYILCSKLCCDLHAINDSTLSVQTSILTAHPVDLLINGFVICSDFIANNCFATFELDFK
jgi:hypothetical protein